ncbi:MAG: hypothetical protein HQ511_03420, partial [Rhodospirillales bacterium]|nr:hypothetical protein [Rhodospirillales bacterium]
MVDSARLVAIRFGYVMNFKIKRFSVVVAINFLLIGVLFESAGALIYYDAVGKIIYVDDHSSRTDEETGNPFKILDMTIHPYFGFTSRISETTNNDAFKFWPQSLRENPGCCDFPMQKRA